MSSTPPKASGAKVNSSSNADLPLISNIYSGFFEHPNASNWEQIHDADSFSFTKNDEPSQPFRFDKRINLEFRASSLSLPLVVSWIFQSCPIIGCIELNNLVSQIYSNEKKNSISNPHKTGKSGIVGGIQFINTATKKILYLQVNSSTPGIIHIQAKNEHGTARRKVYLVHPAASLSIVTDDVWNPYLKRFEIATHSNLVLECRASFFMNIIWRHEKKVLGNSSRIDITQTQPAYGYFVNHRIKIKNIVEKDAGSYSCAEGVQGRSHLHVTNKMKPKIKSNFQDAPDHKIERNVDDSIDLKCSVVNRRMSVTSFVWVKNGEIVLQNDRNVMSKFDTTISDELNDDYDAGDSQENLFEITKKIIKLTENDEGNYSCVVTNAFGRDEHFVLVSVQSTLRLQYFRKY